MTSFVQLALKSPDGPAFWLKVLPAGSISVAGDETFGGYQARKYAIQATVEGMTITGMAWLDPSVPALIGARLTIPGKLTSAPTEGNLQIEYQLEKADVALIQEKATSPNPTATVSVPGGLQVYQDARNIVSQPGVFMYDTDADVATIKQFYLDQFVAGGWQISGQELEASGTYIANWVKDTLSINLAITANQPSGSLVMITCDGCK